MTAVFDNFAELPGFFIKEELEARNWSQRDLAYILGYSEQTVTKLISGKQGITAEMAKALGGAFGTSAELWSNLQSSYDLRLAREPDPAIKVRADLQALFPIREMIHRGWLEKTDQSLFELQITRFFEADSFDEIPKRSLVGAAKRTSYDNDPAEQIAWLFRVRQIARQIKAPTYSRHKLEAALAKLRTLTLDPEDVRLVPPILLECGVRYVVAETLPSAHKDKIDGVCTWLDDDTPVIGMSTFYDRMDNFWLVLRHEIEHVIRGHGKAKSVLDNLEGSALSDGDDVTDDERVANSAALNFCYSRDKLLSFYKRKAPYISERDVVGFSALMEAHPSIAVGQIQYLKDDYRWLRKFHVRIRKYLLETAIYDGWGQVAATSL
ncbi:HigA family addiction module antitoxin [Taklimakanibacter lacteus]|uniref:HigA family addiction module antitoxin n=1 Tax=Taklimakanibacter lacteus TaxID=2268456 RepID=UPI000E671F0E